MLIVDAVAPKLTEVVPKVIDELVKAPLGIPLKFVPVKVGLVVHAKPAEYCKTPELGAKNDVVLDAD